MSGDHFDFATLLDYWIGDLPPAQQEAVDLHLLACDACGAQVDEIAALAAGVRSAFDEGRVHAFVPPAFIDRLGERGVRVRRYRIPRNGSVNCTVTPDDDLLATTLEVPLEGVTRLDAVSDVEGTSQVVRDIPFDASQGVVVMVPPTAMVRGLPSHVMRVKLLSIEDGRERELGTYTFNHTRAPGSVS